ncbi:MAG TPA: hypothetical protein VES92_12455, partial [Nitrospiraceae bacterium]|nr:hypothetical protein [Nitrospiraceae bacterium]
MKLATALAGLLLAIALIATIPGVSKATDDPLPSWNDGSVKQAVVDFVDRVTTEGGPDFVAPPERVATFDNDGTLWSEQPVYFQLQFALDRVKTLAPQHPEWKEKQPFKALLEGDKQAFAAGGEKALLEVMAVSHSGMTTEEFEGIVKEWLATAKHPRFTRPYHEVVYQPMLELLAYLRANGFKTFI